MTSLVARLPRLKFMRDCLLRKHEVHELFDSSYFCEIKFLNEDMGRSLTLCKHGQLWMLFVNEADLDCSVEIESSDEEGVFSLIVPFQESEDIYRRFEVWFDEIYQEVSAGYIQRALFESAPPTDFETRVEERISHNFQEATLH